MGIFSACVLNSQTIWRGRLSSRNLWYSNDVGSVNFHYIDFCQIADILLLGWGDPWEHTTRLRHETGGHPRRFNPVPTDFLIRFLYSRILLTLKPRFWIAASYFWIFCGWCIAGHWIYIDSMIMPAPVLKRIDLWWSDQQYYCWLLVWTISCLSNSIRSRQQSSFCRIPGFARHLCNSAGHSWKRKVWKLLYRISHLSPWDYSQSKLSLIRIQQQWPCFSCTVYCPTHYNHTIQ